jgi:hypothetical protein
MIPVVKKDAGIVKDEQLKEEWVIHLALSLDSHIAKALFSVSRQTEVPIPGTAFLGTTALPPIFSALDEYSSTNFLHLCN